MTRGNGLPTVYKVPSEFESNLLHHPVLHFSDISENRAKRAKSMARHASSLVAEKLVLAVCRFRDLTGRHSQRDSTPPGLRYPNGGIGAKPSRLCWPYCPEQLRYYLPIAFTCSRHANKSLRQE
jgi:hypothetical protein